MGKLRDNLNLIFSNLLFGANFSIYVSLVRNWFDFRQLFLLQVGAAALFFIPFALLSPRTPRMRWADLKNILIVTVLIIYGWMYTMLWGATYTNPVDASILATLGPVFTLLIAVGMHREHTFVGPLHDPFAGRPGLVVAVQVHEHQQHVGEIDHQADRHGDQQIQNQIGVFGLQFHGDAVIRPPYTTMRKAYSRGPCGG